MNENKKESRKRERREKESRKRERRANANARARANTEETMVSIRLSVEEWQEVLASLETKMAVLEHRGVIRLERQPEQDRRWVTLLNSVHRTISGALGGA